MKVCNAFCALGHQVQLWVPGLNLDVHWDDLKSLYGIGHDFPIRWLRSPKFLKKYDFALRAILSAKFWKADLFYIWPLQAAALASWLNLPTILEVHDRPRGRFGPKLLRIYLEGSGAVRLLPITVAMCQWLAEFYKIDLVEPFAIISPMGVELEQFENLPDPSDARQRLGLAEGFTAGYTGHLYHGRGLELLYKLAIKNPSINFLWVGGEKDAIEFWRERGKNDGVNNLHIHGFVPNERLPLFQAACEVLMMPYEKEVSVSSGADTSAFASPMKVFEYLAAGRAILSSDLPVLLEILNSANSVILPIDNVDAWNDALQNLQNDELKLSSLSDHAKLEAQHYSWIERAKRSIENL